MGHFQDTWSAAVQPAEQRAQAPDTHLAVYTTAPIGHDRKYCPGMLKQPLPLLWHAE